MLSSGCLATVLGYCATDFSNPLAREWALLTVRNACENNETNQRFIESLQPQGVVQDESLRSRGISVEMDPLSGKFSFKQQQQTSTVSLDS